MHVKWTLLQETQVGKIKLKDRPNWLVKNLSLLNPKVLSKCSKQKRF